MTITYSLDVSRITLTTVFKLLFKWKGSVYKKLYQEFFIYVAAYFAISLTYRFALDSNQRNTFEEVCLFMNYFADLVPIAFILGFYVSIVFGRWQNIWNTIPWPDNAILTISTFLNKNDNVIRSYRQTLVRYLLAALVVVFRDVSAAVRKRFPTLQHIVDAGILRAEELEVYERATHCNSHKYYVIIQWCLNMLAQCRREERFASDVLLRESCNRVLEYRNGLGGILGQDWVSVPLIYTQIVAMAVWYYFAVCLLGRQYLDPSKNYKANDIDIYVPIFTFLQFWFYMGWLKAAEGMLNPFGEDDDDFELNYIIERNFKVGISQTTELCGGFPALSQELDVETASDAVIPHTEASLGQMDNAPVQSAENIVIPEKLARKASRMSSTIDGERGFARMSIQRGSRKDSKISKISASIRNNFRKGSSAATSSSSIPPLGLDNPALIGSQNSLSPSEILALTRLSESEGDRPNEALRSISVHRDSEPIQRQTTAVHRLETLEESNEDTAKDEQSD